MSNLPGEPRLGPARVAESGEPLVEQKAKVEISLNAKQDAQWRIVAVEGVTEDEMGRLSDLAVGQHRKLQRELMGL